MRASSLRRRLALAVLAVGGVGGLAVAAGLGVWHVDQAVSAVGLTGTTGYIAADYCEERGSFRRTWCTGPFAAADGGPRDSRAEVRHDDGSVGDRIRVRRTPLGRYVPTGIDGFNQHAVPAVLFTVLGFGCPVLAWGKAGDLTRAP
ncbi:hypothetical protein ACHZ98_23230 [Streptomyces sp. MAR4 CNY-716]